MATRDIKNSLSVNQSLAPASRTASANGTGVDTRDYDSVAVVFSLGLYTAGEFTFDVEESDDDVTYTSVASDDLQGTLPTLGSTDDDNVDSIVGYSGSQRYVRAVCATGSPTGDAVFGATVVLSHPHQEPVA